MLRFMPTAPETPEPRRPPKRGGRMGDQAAVEEVPVWLELNGIPVVTWMCTPDLLEELAVGWLAGEGYIEGIDQLRLRPCATDLASMRTSVSGATPWFSAIQPAPGSNTALQGDVTDPPSTIG